MQKAINYTDFFQFVLYAPILIFQEVSDAQILRDCFEMLAYPIVTIKDKKHPLFIEINKELKRKGVKQDLKSVVLVIGYDKPYLS